MSVLLEKSTLGVAGQGAIQGKPLLKLLGIYIWKVSSGLGKCLCDARASIGDFALRGFLTLFLKDLTARGEIPGAISPTQRMTSN